MKSYIVFCIFVTFLGVQVSPCRVGYHNTDNGYCCLSVVCPKDHQFHLCTENLGSDTCTPCDKGQINPDEIRTTEWSYERDDLCQVPDCECSVPDTVLDNPQECRESTGRPVCVCKRKDWYYGQDPFKCNLANISLKMSAKEKGVELTQEGTVRPCLPGYFKSQYGGSICSPHSKCPQGFTVDIEGTAIQDTTCKRSLSSSVPTTPTSSSAEADQDSTAMKSDLVIGLSIGLGAVIAVVLILGLICWLKNRRRSDRTNNIGGVSVDPESGSTEPLIEEKEKKDLSAPTGSQIQDCCTSQKQEHLKGKDDQERGSKESEKKKDLPESGQTHTLKYDLNDPIEFKWTSLDFSSLFESQPKSGLSSRGDSLSFRLSISKESVGGSLQTTSEDLGIGLSADSKNVDKIQKSGQTQGKEEQPVQREY